MISLAEAQRERGKAKTENILPTTVCIIVVNYSIQQMIVSLLRDLPHITHILLLAVPKAAVGYHHTECLLTTECCRLSL